MDKFNLERFVKAQEIMYDHALREIKSGKKYEHWIWFIFPQLRGLGTSENSVFYGISGLEEAKAYLEHSILGARLKECCVALLSHKDKTAYQILGGIDTRKLCSSMTLFACASEENNVFQKVLEQFFDGEKDFYTTTMLYSK
jgi:uncharacterized protein (DUF1810 family)